MLSGLDSLYVSYFFIPKPSGVDWDDLAFRKARLRAGSGSDGEEITLGSQTFLLQPYGSKPYSYVLRNRDFIVRLAENLNPCCHVQFLAEGLWQHGVNRQLRAVKEWAASVGLAESRPAVVGRADWAFDFHLETLDFDEDHFVSLAVKDNQHRKYRRVQTFTFGTGDKVVRAYDKSAEIEEESGKTWFYELWGRTCDVWRVEFQLREMGLREHGIKHLPDLPICQRALLWELATKHTSLRVPSADTNRSRWPRHPLWKALEEAIQALPESGEGTPTDPRLPPLLRVQAQEKSVYGHLKGIGALWTILEGREQPLTLEETVARLKTGMMRRHHNRVEWAADLEDRRRRYELGEW
jgi:hypothetical protein